MKKPQKVLMVLPDYFKVEYAINPHMKKADGSLNQVDPLRAREEWNHLYHTYKDLGLQVFELEGQPAFPDMVFAANQVFAFLDPWERSSFILSNMHSPERKGEVTYFESWAHKHNIQTFHLPSNEDFEGCGDAIPFEANTATAGSCC